MILMKPKQANQNSGQQNKSGKTNQKQIRPPNIKQEHNVLSVSTQVTKSHLAAKKLPRYCSRG